MSTSLLTHAFGATGYHYVRTEYKFGQVIFDIQSGDHPLRCSKCGSTNVVRRGQKKRLFRTVPIGTKTVFLKLTIPRIGCQDCGLVRQVKITFADERRTYTHAFERYVLELSKMMTIQDIAKHLNVGWDMIKDIQKRYLIRHYSKPKLKDLHFLAVDEIAIAKGHRYLTVVLDLESGAVVFVGDGKGSDSLKPFFKRLRRSGAKIKAIAVDMSPAYSLAIKSYLKDTAIVIDHFHVIKLFNEKLSKFRRDLQRDASIIEKHVLKGTRWLLLKNPENLEDKRNEWQRLEAALKINQPLATVYYMKEDLRQFWKQPNQDKAHSFLADWINRASVSGITMLKKFAMTLGALRTGLLAYYDYPISTGPLEGTNNKIKTMKRQAYGFRDIQFFKLKIMAIHKTKYALVG
jgi:transposase